MKKIIFCDVPMQSGLKKMNYATSGGKVYDKGTIYAINPCVSESIKNGDDVKIVLLKKNDVSGNSDKNIEEFKAEFADLTAGKDIKINYVILETPFEETREIHEKLLRDMIGELEEKAEVYADITYGPKPLPIIMFSVLRFGEKFFKCNVKRIVYGKVDFVKKADGVSEAVNPVIYDVTPLYYLDSVTNVIDCKSHKEAVQVLDLMLSMR